MSDLCIDELNAQGQPTRRILTVDARRRKWDEAEDKESQELSKHDNANS